MVKFLLAPFNERPLGRGAVFSTTAGRPIHVDLSSLAEDADADPLTFSLVHKLSSRGADLTIDGSTVTYTPGEADAVDGFVFGVSDGKGGVSHAVVTVHVGR